LDNKSYKFFLKETLPPNKNAAFKGYHLPFIGYTYTENSLLNDCQSLFDLINSKSDILLNSSNNNINNTNESIIINQLENEKKELLAKLAILQQQQQQQEPTINLNNNDEINFKLDQSQLMLNASNEQISQLNLKLNEMTTMYENSKQNELDEKNKIKHLERSVRALKIEKDQLFTQVYDLQERVNLQAKDLSEAQNQRKLAVQEFTDVNEKVNELRSKNAKLSNDILKKEDEIDELKRLLNENKFEIDEFKLQISSYNETIMKLEADLQQQQQQRKEDKSITLTDNLKSESETIDDLTSDIVKMIEDESLKEMNTQLNKDLKQLEQQQLQNLLQIEQLQELNTNLNNEIQSINERNLLVIQDLNDKLTSQLIQFNDVKEKEFFYFKTEIQKLNEENENFKNSIFNLQMEKKTLEEEISLFNETKQAMSKYDWQINEILQMVNEEKMVRGHLKTLASKLIEEVDTLRSQTTSTNILNNSTNNINNNNNNNNSQITAAQISLSSAGVVNGATNTATTAWKNRCSERRDRINAQNMQIALEKEFQAKEKLIEENNTLKHDLDLRSHKIIDLQSQVDLLNKEILKNQSEIKQIKEDYDNQSSLLLNGNAITTPNTTSLARQPSALSTTSSIHNNLNHNQQQQQPIVNLSSSSISSSSNQNYKLDDVLETSDSIIVEPTTQQKSNKQNDIKKQQNLNNKTGSLSSNSAAALNVTNTTTTSQSTKQTNNCVGHKFEVITFQTIERCEYCCGILYGICRQAVKCENKGCNYLCHPKCRQYLPTNCPININQRVQLKGVDFTKGIGTLMQGSLKVPKLGGVKKGWQDHYVFLSNARLFVCPILDNKPNLIPAQIIDIKDPNFSVSPVSESDVIHASKRDIPCILKVNNFF
jgi:serine/threonine-protein kinase MRCK